MSERSDRTTEDVGREVRGLVDRWHEWFLAQCSEIPNKRPSSADLARHAMLRLAEDVARLRAPEESREPDAWTTEAGLAQLRERGNLVVHRRREGESYTVPVRIGGTPPVGEEERCIHCGGTRGRHPVRYATHLICEEYVGPVGGETDWWKFTCPECVFDSEEAGASPAPDGQKRPRYCGVCAGDSGRDVELRWTRASLSHGETEALREALERRAENLRSDAKWVTGLPLAERIDSARRELIAAQFRGAATDCERAARALTARTDTGTDHGTDPSTEVGE